MSFVSEKPASWARSNWGLCVASVIGLGAYGAMVATDATEGTLRADMTPRTIGLYLFAFVGFAIAVWWQERRTIPWGLLLVIPLIFRLLLVFTTPTLSDDVYRYLWDGHLNTEGVNPYNYTIDDPRLDPYEIEARALVNNRSYASPYLPTAQITFAATAFVAPSQPSSMQLLMVGLDLLVVGALVRLLAMAGLPRGRMMLYWWNPLVIVEIAHGAHLDALMVALGLLAVLFTLRDGGRTAWLGPVLLALATLTRPLPLLLVPVLWWRWTWSQRLIYPVAAAVMLVPYAIGGGWGLFGEPTPTGVFGSIRVFVSEVSFNSGIYNWLESWLGRTDIADPASLARLSVGAVFVVWLAEVWRRARNASGSRELMRVAVLPFMGYVLLTSILHPWYLILLMALLPFFTPGDDEDARRWWLVVPWMYLAAVVVFSYLTYIDPLDFGEIEWVRRLEWYPTLLLVIFVPWFAARRGEQLHSAQN